MYILHRNRIVFVHVPKAGGTSIAAALGVEQNKAFLLAHATAEEVIELIFQDDWADFYSFAVVRNPWARYRSLYRYHRSGRYAALLGRNLSHQLASTLTIDDWFDYNIDSHFKSNWFGVPQSRWTEHVTDVFQLERLEDLVDRLESRLGRRIKIPRLNHATGSRGEKLGKRAIEYIAEVDASTIGRFGYSPPAG